MGVQCDIKNEIFWEALKEALLLNCEYENAKDVVSILQIAEGTNYFDEDFWKGMSD